MALSRLWQTKEIWREAFRGVNFPQNDAIYNERFVLINRAVISTIGQFYDLVATSYMTSVTSVPSNDARYYVSGASWDADTNRLTVTMDTDFTATDVGKFVVFHDGTSGYAGTVSEFVSTTVVELEGDNLPSSDIATVDYVIMLATAPGGDTLNLSSLKIMRYGQQVAIDVQSSVTTTLEAVTLERLRKFRSSAAGDLKKIVWAFVGDNLYLDKGDSLSSYGTLTIFYPKTPDEVTTDDDYLDVPDGPAIEIVIMKVRALVAERLNINIDQSAEMERLIRLMYQTFGAAIDDEAVKQKALALK